jgi:hypothetical protein
VAVGRRDGFGGGLGLAGEQPDVPRPWIEPSEFPAEPASLAVGGQGPAWPGPPLYHLYIWSRPGGGRGERETPSAGILGVTAA